MASPTALRAAAARLEQEAGSLPSALDRVVAASGPEVWDGPAARRLTDRLVAHRQRLSAAAEELRAVVFRLRQRADAGEGEVSRMEEGALAPAVAVRPRPR